MEMKIRVMNNIVFGLLLVILTVSGCKLTEPYKQPDGGIPNSFYGSQMDTSADSALVVDMKWNEFFQDTLLIALIDTALSSNRDLQIADAYVAISESRLKQAKANFFPSIGASPFNYRQDYFSENYNNFGSNRARRNHENGVPESLYTERLEYQLSVNMSWEVDIWGKLSAQKKAAQLSYMNTQEFRKAVKTSLIAEIATTYYNLALLKSQIEVYKDNFALNDSTLFIVKLQYDAGEVTSLAVKQTLSQKLRAQTLIPQLEREYIRQENQLNRLIGRNSQAIIIGDLEEPMMNEEFITGQPIQLLSNRPDVAGAEIKLKESYERVGVANAMRYPSVRLGAGIGLNSMELGQLLNPMGSGMLLLNGLVFQPIFQQRKLKTNYEIALKQKEIAELQFLDRFQLAMNEVSNALVAIEKLQEEYTIAQERVEAAQNAVKDASFLFRSGLANYLEVITAQREALDSDLNLVRAKMRMFAADVELYRSLGGGWK